MSVLSGLNLEKMTGLSQETKKTVHNNKVSVLSRVSVKRVSAVLTVFPRIIAGGGYFFFAQKGGDYSRDEAIIKRRRLSQILLTGSRTLNILFYFLIKSKNNHIK